MSVSVAVTVKARFASSAVVLFPGFVTTGAEFTSFTVTWIVSKSVWDPLSVTRTVIGKTPGPCASVGVQENAPAAVIAAPAGAPASSENVYGGVPPVAVAVKVKATSSFTVLFPITASTGCGIEFTVIVIASKALSAGLPLSVTRTVTGNVPLAEGVQLKAPVEELIVAPAGAPASSENANVFAGMSESVAVAVKVTAWLTCVVLFPIAASTGAEFTSVTVIVIAALPLSTGDPLSVATIVTGYVFGPCASVGVQEKAPVPAPIVAPVAAGVPSVSDQAIVLAGRSVSVAVTVKARFASSAVVLFPGFVTTGAEFTSFTVTWIVSKSVWDPLSVTRTVIG